MPYPIFWFASLAIAISSHVGRITRIFRYSQATFFEHRASTCQPMSNLYRSRAFLGRLIGRPNSYLDAKYSAHLPWCSSELLKEFFLKKKVYSHPSQVRQFHINALCGEDYQKPCCGSYHLRLCHDIAPHFSAAGTICRP